jgi:hypothetical protein
MVAQFKRIPGPTLGIRGNVFEMSRLRSSSYEGKISGRHLAPESQTAEFEFHHHNRDQTAVCIKKPNG